MEIQASRAYIAGCFREEPASCECVCPFHLEIRSFLKKMAKGRWPAAYRDLCGAIAFPSIAAELCPRPCEGRCQRTTVGGDAPLNMGELERACLRLAASEKAQDFPLLPKTQRIAVVGAGPAGLACALALARKKFRITVFDKAESWGGHLRSHAAFARFEADFQKQFASQSVDFRFGTEAEEKALEDFDAVYVATGSPSADFGLGEGWDPENFTTRRPGWFLGGGAANMPLMESVAAGSRLSQLIEAYVQTGRASLVVERTAACEGHFVPHPGVESAPGVVPAAPEEGYSKDEAKAEAARCMQCVCDGCMTACELMTHYRKTPDKLATQVCSDSNTIPPLSNCELTRQTYSCNLCGRCADRCPEGVDLGALFQFSRADRWKQKKWVPGLHDYWLRTLDFSGGEGFYASTAQCSRLFFPGCQLTAVCPEHVLSAYRLLAAQEATGIILGCCGASAIWAGDEDRQAENLKKVRGAWEAMGRPAIVTACASCTDLLKKQLPEAEYRSLYELLDAPDAPHVPLPFASAAVFDPCAARHDGPVHEAVRSIAEKAGCGTESLPDGDNCCGFGGHIRLANPGLYDEITEHRAAESPLPYLVYCANCLEVFRSRGKPAAHILDAVFGPAGDGIPTLEEKRRNTLRVKGTLMEELEHKPFAAETMPWDALTLEFSDAARTNMEDKLITDRDAAEAIFCAERDGDYFTDDAGLRTACLVRDVLTYWVDYRVLSEGGYRVESAYCHRMRIDEGV